MSDEKNSAPPKLTIAQKETAKRLGMSEKDYATCAAEQIKRGKLKREHIT